MKNCYKHDLEKTRPTPISRVRDLQNDLALLRMTQYTLKCLKMTQGKEINERRKSVMDQPMDQLTNRPTNQPTDGQNGVHSRVHTENENKK